MEETRLEAGTAREGRSLAEHREGAVPLVVSRPRRDRHRSRGVLEPRTRRGGWHAIVPRRRPPEDRSGSTGRPPLRTSRTWPVRSNSSSASTSSGEDAFRAWLSDLDPGDIVGAEGTAAVSRRGEPSLRVRSLTLLAKAIAPPPEKYHGLQDVEERLRRRYVDLLSSAESRHGSGRGQLLIGEIRRYFDERRVPRGRDPGTPAGRERRGGRAVRHPLELPRRGCSSSGSPSSFR